MTDAPRTAASDGDDLHVVLPAAFVADRATPQDEPGPWSASRRTFLSAVGFAAAGAVAGCTRPAPTRAVPGHEGAEAVVPGLATWYASTCGGCEAGCGVLVKCRDGRPVKLEGNPDHPVSRGGLCAAGQAHLLGLYDSHRLRRPSTGGRELPWTEVDRRMVEALRGAGGVRVLTGSAPGPSTRAALGAFCGGRPDARHVAYDALSASAIAAAHARTHGIRAVPRYRFDRARTVLAIEADFLGTWISPVEHTAGWRAARSLGGKPTPRGVHVQVESAFTVTGAAADRRWRASPAELRALVAHVTAGLARRAGLPAPEAASPVPLRAGVVEDLVERLWAGRPDGLVVCGVNDTAVQASVNLANQALGAYGRTLDLDEPSFQRAGDDAALAALVEEMEAGRVAVLVVAGCNPVVDSAVGARFRAALARVPTSVVLAERPDETAGLATFLLPAPHALEAWEDAEPVAGVVSLTQPAIAPFGEPRSLRACLAAWSGTPGAELDLLRDAWARVVHPRIAGGGTPSASWTAALQAGFARVAVPPSAGRAFDAAGATPIPASAPADGRLAVVLHATVGMLDGRHAHNPWLHELPDPVTKTVWDNVASLSPATAAALGVQDGDVVRVEAEGAVAEFPALVQAGLHDGVVALALGYGRLGTDRFHDVGPRWIEGRPTVERGGAVGVDASPFLRMVGGDAARDASLARVTRTGRRRPLALAQTWPTQDLPAGTAPHGHERRDVARQTTLAAWSKDPASGTPVRHGSDATLWGGEGSGPGPRWRMAVDLDACTGCGACVVSCQAENNVPVVGRDEVARRRDLAWIRVDRYYEDVPGAPGEVETLQQPMTCHHCGNAPCETVCPVLATVHTADGLNAQVYNRCVGTRYCANNCPWKVRRFNWFAYDRTDPMADLQLNPDVTVRSRGVMEKCSFCVQRIHEARAQAKARGVPVADGEVRTACQQSCPARAIVFGDGAAPDSAVARLAKDPRHYVLFEELNLRPSLGYLTKVRDRPAPAPEVRHG